MRKFMPILVPALLGLGCSIPDAHDPKLLKRPPLPMVEEAPPKAVSEGSLWQDRSVVSDMRASRLNDLVTLKISESTSALSKADTSTARDGSNNLNTGGLFGSWGALGTIADPRSTSTTNKYKGSGTTGRSATFSTTVTARVVKVLSNGNLIFEGFRDIKLNNETQRLYVAGMIDPMRLDTTNTIGSAQVAELRIGYGGKGVVDETLKPGYISRLLNYVWPF